MIGRQTVRLVADEGIKTSKHYRYIYSIWDFLQGMRRCQRGELEQNGLLPLRHLFTVVLRSVGGILAFLSALQDELASGRQLQSPRTASVAGLHLIGRCLARYG